ncbi:ABC transporter permease [Conexibacter arvalis]|uniref:Putative ABC transport system permease protein n=1 Tax=Conexibacter arvalis TaxID=912552 RepID=A0A840IHP6_9ACTN|nr:ABC transporter permease [Conexibacter arvalis]MBB4663835.1 putative ABC transport system permease protein [Conexibacter arvalis]
MLPLRTLLYFYRRRLRVHWMQELLAAVGIATGVALVFGVQVANTSITGSARQIVEGITGEATLQLSARDTTGFDREVLAAVKAAPGVERAAGVLEQRATVAYEGRRISVDLVGIDRDLPRLGGTGARSFQLGGLLLQRAIALPEAVGDVLELPALATGSPAAHVALGVRGRARSIEVAAVLGRESIGGLSGSTLAVVSLPYAQDLARLPGRLSRLFVVAEPGREQQARASLERIAADRLTVSSIDHETRLLEQATGPIDQSTGLFAAISAFVGVLFVFNAMLLTVPERRRFIADLRILGYRPGQIVQILLSQAAALGLAASAVGVVVGYLLSRTAAQHPPGYLALAFPIGLEPVIEPAAIVLALVGGVAAACLAAAQPLLDLRAGRAVDAVFGEHGEPGHAISRRTRVAMAYAGTLLIAAATVVALAAPSLTVVGVGLLALAVVLFVPAAFTAVLWLAERVALRGRFNMLLLAVRALRATTVRSLALAATGAVAVFGTVAIEGAHDNLLDGLYEDYAEYAGTADVWVSTPDDDLALQPFDADGMAAQVAGVDGVRAVREYRGGLLDLGDRRVWVIGRPPEDAMPVPRSQIVDGDPDAAMRRLRAGGWITVSRQLAETQEAGVGDLFALPTPTGTARFRIAATTTNLGWGAGAVVLNGDDHRARWPRESPTALEVDVEPGADPAAVAAAIDTALGPGSALQVQATADRMAHANALARDGLARLSQIALLLLIAAVLAMASAMGAGIWQRRATFAQLRIEGFRAAKLWRALLLETGIVLGTGCLTGALAGIYGHWLGNRWLELTTGYPAPFDVTAGQTVLTCVLVAAAALAVSAVPGYLVARTPARLGLDAT